MVGFLRVMPLNCDKTARRFSYPQLYVCLLGSSLNVAHVAGLQCFSCSLNARHPSLNFSLYHFAVRIVLYSFDVLIHLSRFGQFILFLILLLLLIVKMGLVSFFHIEGIS